jgi:hypothetical protein
VSRNTERTRHKDLDRARDELFSHIHRCGVLQANEEHQLEWMNDTVEYLGERYPGLAADDLDALKQIGMRFCRPVIQHGEDAAEDHSQGDEEATNEVAAA